MATQFDISVLFKLVDKLSGPMGGMQNKLTQMGNKFNKVGDGFIKTGTKLTLGVTTPLVGLGIMAVKSAAKFEQYQVAFKTMLGSGDKARKMLGDLKTFAAKTPLQLSDLAQGAQTMLAFNISAEKILPNLKMLGDVALGDAEKLKSLTLSFSQVQSKGRLQGDDLRQMINVGFNPLQIIAEKTGLSMGYLQEAMSAGAISADMVTHAFKVATSEGGKFFNALKDQSLTTTGSISTLLDNIESMAAAFGELLLPIVNKIVLKLTTFAKKIKNLSKEKKQLIMKILAVAAVLGPLLIIIGLVLKFVAGIILAFKIWALVNTFLNISLWPIMVTILAIIAAVVLIILAIKNWGAITKWFSRIWKVTWSAIKKAYSATLNFFANLWDSIWGGIKKAFFGFIDGIKVGWNKFMELLDNPIIAGLGMIFAPFVTGPALIIKHWTPIKEFFVNLWDGISNAFNTAWEKISGIGENIAKVFTNIVDKVKENPIINWLFGGKKDVDVSGGEMTIDINVKADKGTTATIGKMSGNTNNVKARTDSTVGNNAGSFAFE